MRRTKCDSCAGHSKFFSCVASCGVSWWSGSSQQGFHWYILETDKQTVCWPTVHIKFTEFKSNFYVTSLNTSSDGMYNPVLVKSHCALSKRIFSLHKGHENFLASVTKHAVYYTLGFETVRHFFLICEFCAAKVSNHTKLYTCNIWKLKPKQWRCNS